MKPLGSWLLLGLLALAGAALAQKAGEPERVRGVLTQVDRSSIMLRTRDGQSVRIALAPNVAV